MRFIIFAVLLGLSVQAHYNAHFNNWMLEHGKLYKDTLEMEKRFLVFSKNIQIIAQMNQDQVGGPDVEFGLNQFADLTEEEFSEKILMAPQEAPQFPEERYLKRPNVEVPESFDWRDQGAVGNVKDQGTVGTCWTFSTTGNIEGVHQRKTGKMVLLSSEQLVDCDGTTDPANKHADCGVFGGWPYLAFQYIIKAGGIDPEVEYPYCVGGGSFEKSCFPCMAEGFTEELCGPPIAWCNATQWPCRKERSVNAIRISNWASIKEDEVEIAEQLVAVGPLSIGLNASMLQFYRKGIFDPTFCNPNTLNHAVLLVGYGQQKNKPYWIVKNSWGQKWGETGYFRIAKGKKKCGVDKIVATAII